MAIRRLFGDVRPQMAKTVASAQAVEVYDAVCLLSNTIIRAADTVWGTAVAAPTTSTLAWAPRLLKAPMPIPAPRLVLAGH